MKNQDGLIIGKIEKMNNYGLQQCIKIIAETVVNSRVVARFNILAT